MTYIVITDYGRQIYRGPSEICAAQMVKLAAAFGVKTKTEVCD